MEKLADGLQRLDEDSLLQVVQLIHDNRTQDTYLKNDVESETSEESYAAYITEATNRLLADGEFHVDLYTLPDNLVKTLWDFTAARTEL